MSQTEALQELYQEEIYKLPGKTLVILPDSWDTLDDANVQLLSKILASVKLSLSHVQIIVTLKIEDVPFHTYKPSRILLFGVSSDSSIAKYQLTRFNEIPVISADALDTLDDAKKKNLWLALKTMFAV